MNGFWKRRRYERKWLAARSNKSMNEYDEAEEHISLCDTLDRVLNKGVVVAGEVVISVADIDLVYLGLRLVLTSVETARQSNIGMASDAGKLAGGTA
jgi:gas vesicle structural protein